MAWRGGGGGGGGFLCLKLQAYNSMCKLQSLNSRIPLNSITCYRIKAGTQVIDLFNYVVSAEATEPEVCSTLVLAERNSL